jgi:hypothetical protein
LASHSVSERATALFLDCDAQGNESTCRLEGKAPAGPTLTEVMMHEVNIRDAIRPSRHPKIDIVPATLSLAD